MNSIKQILDAITSLFTWWFTVLPWEQAVRIRLGSRVRLFEAGFHLKLPFLDRVYVQNTRRRLSCVFEQTISTKDGKAITLAGSFGYRVVDVLKLYNSLHQAEATISLGVAGLITDFIIHRDVAEVVPADLTAHVLSRLNLRPYGLADEEFFLTDFAVVRTYRFMSGNVGHYLGHGPTAQLDTQLTTDQIAALPQ